MQDLLRVGVAGLGGYAGSVVDVLLCDQDSPAPAVRLSAVCDPQVHAFADRVSQLRGRGVTIHDRFEEMLGQDIDAVWLPVPIDLHRRFTELAVSAGKAVMCEKPPAGCVQDLDAMGQAADRAGRPLLFGFQDIYDPQMLMLKRRLLGGELGRLRSISIHACWPRDSVYYGRNSWAGRLSRDGVWVLDSPLSNALAHPVNLALFLAGEDEAGSARPGIIEGELYRANPIESFDTVAARTELVGRETSILVLLTHACQRSINPVITINADRRSVTVEAGRIEMSGESIRRDDGRVWMPRALARVCRGERAATAVATVATSRPHMILVNALAEACPVVTVTTPHMAVRKTGNATMCVIEEIEPLFQRCAATGKLPAEAGAAWAGPVTRTDARGYSRFGGVATARSR